MNIRYLSKNHKKAKLHELEVTNKSITLDDFQLFGVTDFTIHSSAGDLTELKLELLVKGRTYSEGGVK
ncbi:hypothetical protein [Listeria monocytogenes]|uniref:hypothetical protein n=1 Tax=Listeria monocytogenes TaxID=1639 RepID=UPI000E72C729|nr:hypothetical protein [Listeria monocytogenes]EHY0418233.1 hypothetical protein [Listeria monocytogenes]RJZ23461.1 hypothetical protein DYZ51_01788 [Listeria monocytogenes]